MPRGKRDYFRRRIDQAEIAAKNLEECLDTMLAMGEASPTFQRYRTMLDAAKSSHAMTSEMLLLLERTF